MFNEVILGAQVNEKLSRYRFEAEAARECKSIGLQKLERPSLKTSTPKVARRKPQRSV